MKHSPLKPSNSSVFFFSLLLLLNLQISFSNVFFIFLFKHGYLQNHSYFDFRHTMFQAQSILNLLAEMMRGKTKNKLSSQLVSLTYEVGGQGNSDHHLFWAKSQGQ